MSSTTGQFSDPISVRLTVPQEQAMNAVAKLTGLPRQEHIRRAVDAYLQRWRDAPAKPAATPLSQPLTPQPMPPMAAAPDSPQVVVTHPPRQLKIARR